jgi:argininosuccinate lyase
LKKKNSDSLELLRGKSGRAFGQMAGLMMVSFYIDISASDLALGVLKNVLRIATNYLL